MNQVAQFLVMLICSCGVVVAAEKPLVFEKDAFPILRAHCFKCHGESKQKNKLDLRSRDSVLKGGKSGPAVVAGSLRESLLWGHIATDKMPDDDNKLSDEQKDRLRRWVLDGAHDIRSAASAEKPQELVKVKVEKRGVHTITKVIDKQIAAKLKAAKIPVSPGADDATFLRRVYLDLTGRAPSYAETVQFLEDQDKGKRAKLIDDRLASDEFGRHFAIYWHKLLIPKSAGAYRRIPHNKFRTWLAESFNAGRGWDTIVTDLVTAEGYLPSNKDNELSRKKDAKMQPQNVATAFIDVHNTEGRPQPKGIITSVSRLFMAQSIECAQCHNHPLAKWRKTDFWAAAAFFERVRFEKAVFEDTSISRLMEPIEGKALEYKDEGKGRFSFVPAIYDEPVIDMENANGKRTGRMIRSRYLDRSVPELDTSKPYRSEFARWMTAPENPYFARAYTNRIWGQLLGRGFVEPVDDMSEDNPPSHPQLLAELAAEFSGSGFDIKHLIRCICNSETYQCSSEPVSGNEKDVKLFSHQALKQLTEEQLFATLQITLPTFAAEVKRQLKDKNPHLFEQYFLETYETGTGPATDFTRGLQQALRTMNGDGEFFNRNAILHRGGSDEEPAAVLRRIYLQVLNRPPTAEESARMTEAVKTGIAEIKAMTSQKNYRPPTPKKDRPDQTPDPYADVLWVLVNSGEYMFNH